MTPVHKEGDFIKVNKWLYPLSWIYGLGVAIRNELFEMGLLKQRSFDVPVISVGNITVGGSGKTPHVEYLIRLLKDKAKVAVLSRGYKRKSKGYVLASTDTPMEDIGDEPYQMKQKFPEVNVAVDKNRCEGIDRLTSDAATDDTDVILLDDAFQHRYVKPGINILLVDYHRLIIYDHLLPAGRLREPVSAKHRADIVIITKCPENLSPIDYRVLIKQMDLYPFQKLFFTTLEYDDLYRLFDSNNGSSEGIRFNLMKLSSIVDYDILLLTGIASPEQMIHDIGRMKKHAGHGHHKQNKIAQLTFADHHNFSQRDAESINETFDAIESKKKIIVTTEKDASRLKVIAPWLSDEVKNNLFVLPIRVKFMLGEEEAFNDKIISYVRKNSRNSILAKGEDDNKSKDSHHPRHRPRTISFRDN